MPEPTKLDIENTLQGKSLYLHKRKKTHKWYFGWYGSLPSPIENVQDEYG